MTNQNTASHSNLTGRTAIVRGVSFTIGEEISRSRSNRGGAMLESVRYELHTDADRVPVRSDYRHRAAVEGATLSACEDGTAHAARSYDWIVSDGVEIQ